MAQQTGANNTQRKGGQNSKGALASILLALLVAMLLCDLASAKDQGRDFYKILELKKNAKAADIKKAYRKLTLQYHPDRNAGDEDAK
mmetsp:Transcript_8270/g.11457  ORF Transcript_8270/g.11457 Transcript_8270/m.11457 type:complete len:87 (+) Transcript_8270:1-261(+)